MRLSVPRNVMFGFLSWLLPLCATVVLTPFIVHRMGQSAYGLYALILGFVSFSLNFNMGRAITKYVAGYHARGETSQIGAVLSATVLINLLVAIASALAIALSTNWLIVHALNIPAELRPVARVAFYLAAVGLTLTILSQVLNAVPQAVQRFDLYSYLTMGVGILSIAGNGVLVLLGYSIQGLLVWNIVTTGLSCLGFYIVTRLLLPGAHFGLRFERTLLVGIIRFSAAVTAYQVLGNVLVLFERSWITRTLGPEALAYYVVPMTIGIYLHSFATSLTLVIYPMTSAAEALKDNAQLTGLYTRSMKYVSMLILFLVVSLVTSRSHFLTLWMGADFAQHSAGVLALQVVALGLVAIGIVPWQMADGLGLPGRNALMSLLWLVIACPLMILWTSKYGVVGTSWARLMAALTMPVYALYIERRIFGRCLWRFWGRTCMYLGGAGLATYALQQYAFSAFRPGFIVLLVIGCASAAVFFGSLFLFGFVAKEDEVWLRQLFARATGLVRAERLNEAG